jgi:hydrogenase maturation protease
MSPALVLGMLQRLGGRVDRVVIVGCQPATLSDGIGLSASVAEAVDRGVEAVRDVLAELCEPVETRKDRP